MDPYEILGVKYNSKKCRLTVTIIQLTLLAPFSVPNTVKVVLFSPGSVNNP